MRLNRAHKRNALDDDTVNGIDAFFGALPAVIDAVLLVGEAIISPPDSISLN